MKKTIKKPVNKPQKSEKNLKAGINFRHEMSEALGNHATECNIDRCQVLNTRAQLGY